MIEILQYSLNYLQSDGKLWQILNILKRLQCDQKCSKQEEFLEYLDKMNLKINFIELSNPWAFVFKPQHFYIMWKRFKIVNNEDEM